MTRSLLQSLEITPSVKNCRSLSKMYIMFSSNACLLALTLTTQTDECIVNGNTRWYTIFLDDTTTLFVQQRVANNKSCVYKVSLRCRYYIHLLCKLDPAGFMKHTNLHKLIDSKYAKWHTPYCIDSARSMNCRNE